MQEIPSLEYAIKRFTRAVMARDPRTPFAPTTDSDIESIAAQLPLTPKLISWYGLSAPQVNAHIPQLGDDCEIYAPHAPVERQLGYRWDRRAPKERILLNGWPLEWVVIGDICADPIIADTSQAVTPILMSHHGAGSWDGDILAPSLAAYLEAMATYIDIYFIETQAIGFDEFGVSIRGDLIWDEDGYLLAPLRDKLTHKLTKLLPQDCISLWLD
jgi:hypothetical protein